jgi:ribosomal protein L16 Arg81 hydroxylase
MSDNPQPEEHLSEEFRNLGKNLISAVQAAWDSPDRKRLQDEVVGGLTELGVTLRKEAEYLSNSETGQQVKSNVEQIGERIRSSETQAKVRQELLAALKTANNEIQKVIDRWSEGTPPASSDSEQTADEENSHD